MLSKMKRMLAMLLTLALLAGCVPALAEETLPEAVEISELSAEPETPVEEPAEPAVEEPSAEEEALAAPEAPAPEIPEEAAAETDAEPSAEPTAEPSGEPAGEESAEPTIEPSAEPTAEPTAEPAAEPTVEPAPESSAAPVPESASGFALPRLILNADAVKLGVGEKFALSAALDSGEAAQFSFASKDAKTAAVSKDGVITAKKAGETVITVTSGELSAECAVTVIKAPTKVTLSETKLSMGAGQAARLTAELNNGNESKVTFSTSNKKVATVDENGNITAVAKGTAKITAASYNNKKATCTVTVLAAPTELTLNEESRVLPAGVSVQLKASVNKNAAADYSFVSSDESVASVDESGNIETVEPGTAIITVTTYNGLSAECSITVTPAPESVALNTQSAVLGVSEKLQLIASNDQGCEANYTYASGNAKIAAVDKNGLVTAKKAGSTSITVTSYNGLTASCEITVAKAPTKVTLSAKTLSMGVGQMEILSAALNSGSVGAVSFSSSKAAVASVDENGVITAVSKGKATITAKTYNNRKASCTVTVLAAPETLSLAQTSASLPMGMSLDLKPSVEKGAMANYICVSSDESVATVDNSGKVTAVSEGAAIITVTTYNGITAACKLAVTPAPTKLNLNAEALELGVGEKFQMEAEADQGDTQTFSYRSSKDTIVSVSKGGLLTAKKTGTAVITVSAFNGVEAQCAVTVRKAPSSIKFAENKIELMAGQSAQLTATLNSGSAGSISYASSDETVATVDANGVVYAIAAGAAKISAKTYNGKSASCTVTVEEPSNIIHALRAEDGAVIANVSTIQSCAVAVEVLDENSEAVLMSARADAGAGLQMQDVRVDLPAALPAHFILRAVLKDAKDKNLSSPYVSRRYTSAYDSFESQSPADFPKNKVLDFGEGGYAVYSDNAYPVSGEVTQSGGRYTLMPPAELVPGNVLIIDEQPVKIKTITYNPDGSVSVTEDADIYLADIYDVMNLDMQVALSPSQQYRLRSSQGGVDLVEFTGNFKIGTDEARAELEAGVKMSANVRAFYDKKFFGADYFEYEFVVDAQGSISLSVIGGIDTADMDYNDLSLILFSNFIPVSVPGVNMFVTVELPLDLKAEAEGEGKIGFVAKSGFKYDPVNKQQPIKSIDVDSELSFKGEFEAKVGPKIYLSAAIVCLMGKVTAHAGLLARGTLEGVTTDKEYSADKSFFHACDACIDMELSGFAEIKGALEYKITKNMKGNLAELRLFSGEWEIGDAFLSVINDAESIYGGKLHFDFGDCQNRKYRVRVYTQDAAEKLVTGIPVTISGKGAKLEGKSVMEDYLYPGAYQASAQFASAAINQGFTMPEAALDLTLSESVIDIFGYVTDSSTGKPIPGAKVEITLPGGDQRSALTDDKGYYSFEDVPAGDYSFAFYADKYDTKDGVTASFVSGSENRMDAALDPAMPDKSGVPFISTQAWVSDEEIDMTGMSYSDAVIFRMGYTGSSSTGDIAQVVYNFQGKYSSMSFDAGFYRGWERNAKMTIIADGVTIYDELLIRYEDIARRYTIPLSGVHQLIIHFRSNGYDKTYYAIGDISLTRASATSGKPLVSDEDYDANRYLAQYVDVVKGNFSMGGYNYQKGYTMRMGYGFNLDYESKLGFNLKGAYDTFSFDIARLPQDSYLNYLRSAYLTIEVDGVPVAGYDGRELKWDDITLPVEVNVSGARQLIIKLKSNGYDLVKWGIGNIHLA